MKPFISIALIGSFALSAVAFAEEGKKEEKDPNRMICKAEEQLGSRLRAKKQCMTAAQWRQAQAASRLEIDRNQARRYKND